VSARVRAYWLSPAISFGVACFVYCLIHASLGVNGWIVSWSLVSVSRPVAVAVVVGSCILSPPCRQLIEGI
jgi:hypothetical protein